MTIEIEIIEMPDINEVRATTKMRKEQKNQELNARCEKQYAECMKDLTRFIHFINKKIETAKLNGDTSVIFSFCDSGWKTVDPRCEFQTKGWVSFDFTQMVENIYKNLGFYSCVRKIDCLNGNAYRNGEVCISWVD